VILLDTHIWIWWIQGEPRLKADRINWLMKQEAQGLGVSIISCWEVAKLVENNHLQLPCPIDEWLERALNYPGIRLLELTLPVILESTKLPSPFHRDPADQLIIATARIHDIPLLTADSKILDYPYISTIKP
jgi:PIN domain nuclease of toxin-antitoxin system